MKLKLSSALFAMVLLLAAQVFAGPGKKKRQVDDADPAHRMAVPGLALEEESFLMQPHPLEYEAAAVAQEAEEASPIATTNPADIAEKPSLTERQAKRLNKVESRLNKRIAKLKKKKPNAADWNSQGTRILYIALIIALAAIALSILAAILGGGALGGIAGSAWGIAVIVAIVGVVIGVMD
ncbi:MAG: hypothetical protein AAF998_26840 [Bacteroidota bacterium]